MFDPLSPQELLPPRVRPIEPTLGAIFRRGVPCPGKTDELGTRVQPKAVELRGAADDEPSRAP